MSTSLLDVESSGSDRDDHCGSRPRHWTQKVAISASLALVGCIAGTAVYSETHEFQGRRGVQFADLQATTGLQALPGAEASSAQQVGTPTGFQSPPQVSTQLNNYFDLMMGDPTKGQSTTGKQITCADNEELHAKLCYKQCKILTNGAYPLRTSAWTCCQAEKASDCFIQNQDKNIGLCSGYDVDGKGGCPRSPGTCLDSEELLLGQCYQKCSILTKGTHPHRTSAFSCCDVISTFSCFQPSHVALDTTFVSGGGKGDHNPMTPNSPHGLLTQVPQR